MVNSREIIGLMTYRSWNLEEIFSYIILLLYQFESSGTSQMKVYVQINRSKGQLKLLENAFYKNSMQ